MVRFSVLAQDPLNRTKLDHGSTNLGKGSSMIEGSDSGSESGSEWESGGGVSGISLSLSSTGAGAGTSEEVLML